MNIKETAALAWLRMPFEQQLRTVRSAVMSNKSACLVFDVISSTIEAVSIEVYEKNVNRYRLFYLIDYNLLSKKEKNIDKTENDKLTLESYRITKEITQAVKNLVINNTNEVDINKKGGISL